MPSCSVCQMQGLQWSENVNPQGKHYLYNENTGQPHACKPVLKPDAILVSTDHVIEVDKVTKAKRRIDLGFDVDVKEEEKARRIVFEAVRCGLDPYKVRTERRGDFLILH